MIKNASRNFREKFELPFHFMDYTFSKWYPGHMAKGDYLHRIHNYSWPDDGSMIDMNDMNDEKDRNK